jgi:hypothetical protein
MTVKLSGQGLSLFELAGVPVQTFASSDSTPSVGNGRAFDTTGTTTIVRFDDSTQGQTIAIRATGSISIQHNANIQLAGDVDFVMVAGDAIILTRFDATEVFVEVSRKQLTLAISAYERHASFGVPIGVSSQEATLGRVSFSGSIIINVKKNGVTQMSGVIDGANTEFVITTAAVNTYQVAQNDEISVEVIGDASYDNTPSGVTGLVANVTMTESSAAGAEPSVALLNAAQVFTAGQAVAQSTLADGAGIVVDGDDSNNFDLELTQNSDLANPINVVAGTTINIAIRQDGTGGFTLSFGSAFKFPGGAPTVTATPSAEDIISCYVRTETAGTATVMLCSIAQDHS